MLGGSYGKRVVVVAGKGNNGADGRVAARRLAERGVHVTVLDAASLPLEAPPCDLVIDAAYGTGFRGAWVPPEVGDTPVLAVDIPSGVDGLTGRCGPGVLQATRTAAAVFTVLIGALLFGYFLTITQTPQRITEFLTGLGVGRYGVLTLILLMYLVLGCLMDTMAMIILTVPIIFPVVTQLGFNPIWFGVIIVMTWRQ